MKRKLKLLVTLMLGITLMVGFNSCGKESSGGIEPTPVNPTPNNGGSGTDKPTPEPDDKPTPENPFGDGKVNVFEQVVAVQESEITSVTSDTAAHHYTITYKEKVPDIKTGSVVVVPDGDEVNIILVKKATISGKKVEMEGNLGDYSYVFYNTRSRQDRFDKINHRLI